MPGDDADRDQSLEPQGDTPARLRERATALGLDPDVTAELDELIARQLAVTRNTEGIAREIAAIRASATWRLLEQLRRWYGQVRRARAGLQRLTTRRSFGRRGVVPAAVRRSPPAVNVSGYITAESGMGEAAFEGFAQTISSRLPMRRFGRPEEIAKIVAYLASDDAAWITGQEFVIDGGALATPPVG